MIKKILDDFKKNYKFYTVLLLILLLFLIHLDYYIYSPGGLIDLTDRIEVDKSYKQEGSFNMTYVTSRNGSLANILLSFIIPNWDIESVDDMRIEDEDTTEIEIRDKIYLEESSYDALISAFKEAGLPYNIDSIDLKVSYVYNDANTDIKAGDIIKKINGIEIKEFNDIVNETNKYKLGDKINVVVLRDNEEVDCYSKLVQMDDRVVIGVSIAQMKHITTDPKVDFIYKESESGSSRGLMCALDIYNKITEFDLTKGRIISGTGTIDEEGNVGAIGGVKYKLTGAVKKGADVFIVPSENYEEALKIKNDNKYDIELIEADTLHNVIEKLK